MQVVTEKAQALRLLRQSSGPRVQFPQAANGKSPVGYRQIVMDGLCIFESGPFFANTSPAG
jgi:hypothetical protein